MRSGTALNWLTALVVCVGFVMLLAALGVDVAALGVGSVVAITSGFAIAEYRGTDGSLRRQRRNRQAHCEASGWQHHENDGDRFP